MNPLRRLTRRLAVVAVVLGLTATSALAGAGSANADVYLPITGSGSSWAYNAVNAWITNGNKFGWQVDYTNAGSSRGRADYLANQVDFAVSDIPFQANPTDGSPKETPTAGTYAYMPIVAGGTAFMYNLSVGGKQVTNLRLSGENLARIFTGQVTTWNDPAIAADNPGLTLPALKVVPVIRSDGSGSSAQFSLWMQNQYPAIWKSAYPAGGETSFWPQVAGSQGRSGDDGVANYVSNSSYGAGSIGYVQYSYAKNKRFPVAKMLNKNGYYVEPTPQNVAVALLSARINEDNPNDLANYLTQDLTGTYNSTDPRTYPLSSYSYMILRLDQTRFAAGKASTLGAFGKYLLCDGQAPMPDLGYSPLPLNLVQGAFRQLAKAPGVDVASFDISSCNNPTFSPDGSNLLAKNAPLPPDCDKQGPTQCSTGTGGATAATTVKPAARGTTAAAAGAGTGTAAAGTGASAAASVDPDTGLAVDGGGGGAAEVPLAGPVSLNSSAAGGGWSGSETFAALAGLFLLAVFVIPPILVGRLSRRANGAGR